MRVLETRAKLVLVPFAVALLNACGPSDHNTGGITAGSTVYDYTDYGHNYANKVFSVTGTSYDTMVHVFTRTPGIVSYSRIESYLGTVIRDRNFYLDTSGTTLALYLREHKDVNGNITDSYTFSPGVPLAATTMVIGDPITTTIAINLNGIFVESFTSTITLLAIENVIVPYGSFSDCLKIRRDDGINTRFGGQRTVTSWRCSGYGVVKTTFEYPSQPTITRQLTSATI
ncbi:MAG: hypothetical protein OEY36_09585 [Gammaproteobacteria bacterium]|nr:hypothetical protein [Gammaproteobacteria bacterium]